MTPHLSKTLSNVRTVSITNSVTHIYHLHLVLMLSRPDFLEKQIVTIMSQDLKEIQLKNSNLIVTHEGKIINQVSLLKIFAIFIIGECTITSQLIRQLQQHQIIIYLITKNLRPITMIGNSLQWNYILRSYQYHHTTDQQLRMSQWLIANKITNQLALLQWIRIKNAQTQDAIIKIKALIMQVNICDNQASLRGLEGNAAKLFFQCRYEPLWRYRRAPRTREDVINSLLDIWYSYLYGIIESNLSLYGFDVYQGFYHTLFYERKSLVCDMIEPLRCLIDHTIIKAWNLWQIQDKRFVCKDNERVPKDRPSRIKISSVFLKAILAHKSEIFDYVKSYYRYVMSDWVIVEFPYFSLLSE